MSDKPAEADPTIPRAVYEAALRRIIELETALTLIRDRHDSYERSGLIGGDTVTFKIADEVLLKG
jgi:hypothetical protein